MAKTCCSSWLSSAGTSGCQQTERLVFALCFCALLCLVQALEHVWLKMCKSSSVVQSTARTPVGPAFKVESANKGGSGAELPLSEAVPHLSLIQVPETGTAVLQVANVRQLPTIRHFK